MSVIPSAATAIPAVTPPASPAQPGAGESGVVLLDPTDKVMRNGNSSSAALLSPGGARPAENTHPLTRTVARPGLNLQPTRPAAVPPTIVPKQLSMAPDGSALSAPSDLSTALDYHRQQAFAILDRFLAAKDPVTGLLPLHVKTVLGQLVPTDHVASGLDMGRQTSGLVMAANLARAEGDTTRAERYLDAARTNWAQGKKLLTQGDAFVHLRDFNDDGSVKSTNVGEPGRSAPGEDDMTRVNPRGYAFRGAADLYLATGDAQYKADLEKYFSAWVRDFHDPQGGFFIHSNVSNPSDHTERGTFVGTIKTSEGHEATFDGRTGAKGNDATIYALSGVLLPANEALATKETQGLVKEQMDIILDKLHRQNGMLWENYTPDFQPVSEDWQSQPRVGIDGHPGPVSHVAIGGHTAMASQLVLEGASQLLKQGAITPAQYQSYVDRSVSMFSDFAAHSGAIDWDSGAVHNAMRVEEPDADKRWIKEWGDAGWQQAELLQTLLRVKEAGRLEDIRGPHGLTGQDLLARAEHYYVDHYSMPANYAFDGFGNPDVYHPVQVAADFQEAMSSLRDRPLQGNVR